MSRKIKIFIMASVLFNLLLAGVLAGHLSHRWGTAHRWQAKIELPKERQDHIRAVLRKAFKENRPLYDAMKQSREEALRILKAEPFDEDAYQHEVEKLHALRGKVMQHLADTVKELAKELTPKEREALAAILRRPPPYKRLPGGYPPPPL